MTLIEVTLALAIGAMAVATAVMSLNAVTDAHLRSAAIELSGAIKDNYDRAAMLRRYQRIAMDIDKGVWWVEASENPFALSAQRKTGTEGEAAPEEGDIEERAASRPSTSLFNDDEEAAKAEVRAVMESGHAGTFAPEAKRPNTLPSGVFFSRVWTGHQEEAFTTGIAHIHFFPQGWTEPAVIELIDEQEDIISLKVLPLTGRVRSYHERLEIERPEEYDGREEGDI